MGMKTYYFDNSAGGKPKEWALNWGDIIAPTIVRHFSGSEKIVPTSVINGVKLVTVGSVMTSVRNGDLVWGTGIIQNGQRLPNLGKPSLFAVRGPLTRYRLEQLGFKVPPVYGDPALLYPRVYSPKVEKTHRWGMIPHYVDAGLDVVEDLRSRGVKIIDICAGEREFIDQLLSVERVLSSSLHGLVAADAYGIPNARVVLSDRVFGGDFKFMDYSLAVSRGRWRGVVLDRGDVNLDGIPLNYEIDWDADRLLDAAPWNNPKLMKLFY